MSAPDNTDPLTVWARPMTDADRAYVVGSWGEGYKNAPGVQRLTWAIYKQMVVPQLERTLDRSTCLVALLPGQDEVVGWIAYSPAKRVPAVHWVHTRFRAGDGPKLRKRGVMTQLLKHAGLGQRWVYTRHAGKGKGESAIVRSLASRGVTAVYYKYEEWSQP